MDVNEALEWYRQSREKYVSYTRLLHQTIDNLLRADEVPILAVTSRTKELSSFKEKFVAKSYENPEQSTDLAGIRVITFIEPDARRSADVLRASFKVHESKSVDKSDELGESNVGYRSIHIVGEVGKARAALAEFGPYRGMLFEIQVRTVLQHAWAEIEHDRGYKFSGVLPAPLRRRLNLVAAQLELADLEFARLATDFDKYAEDLRDHNLEAVLAPSSKALVPFLQELGPMLTPLIVKKSNPDDFAGVLDELYLFGAKTVRDVKALLSKELQEALRQLGGSTTQIGLVRKAMIFEDVDRYFRDAWSRRWSGLSASTRALIKKKWGTKKLHEVDQLLTGKRIS